MAARSQTVRVGRVRAGLVFLLFLAAGCRTAPINTERRPDRFVDASEVVDGLVVEMRYAGSENFVGRPIDGYDASVCLLTREAAEALARVQARLESAGLGIKVFDCYRPARAVAHFARWARDPSDTARKADYYPGVDKSRLFELGYIAERSGHSKGSTVDLTLVERGTMREVDMGSPYDLFDTRSWPSDLTVSADQRASRLMLQSVMVGEGFRPLKEEWWHFTLVGEPYPDRYFDFPVTRRAPTPSADGVREAN